MKNSVVQYTNVITNIGGGYNPLQSTFIAPAEGNYFFAWSTSQYRNRYTYTSIVKNGSPLLYVTVGWTGDTQADSTSQTIAIHLSVGDRVWINHDSASNAPYIDIHYMGVFTGFLLR